MQKLNLPRFEYKVKKQQNKPFIWDGIRKKYIQITPEEWVRQHFIHFLIQQGYPKALISVESGLKFNQRQKRSDILVYTQDGSPFFLVECKAPEVAINEKVMEQAVFYNQIIKAPFIGLTNGLHHVFCQQQTNGQLVQLFDLPTFGTHA